MKRGIINGFVNYFRSCLQLFSESLKGDKTLQVGHEVKYQRLSNSKTFTPDFLCVFVLFKNAFTISMV